MKKYLVVSIFIITPVFAAEPVVIQELPLEAPIPTTKEQKAEQPSATQQVYPATTTQYSIQGIDELYTLLDTQGAALQDLTNRLEQMDQQLTQLTKKLETINQDIDFRLKELEKKPIAEPAKPILIDKSSDKERYDFAYEYIKKGDYTEAQKLLTDFTKDFPKSTYIPNALYWLGETYYTQGQYENAVGFFADVFSKHKSSSKAPDALFKMRLSMKGLNNNDAACSAWKGLIAEYSNVDSTLKKRTQEELKKLKCPS